MLILRMVYVVSLEIPFALMQKHNEKQWSKMTIQKYQKQSIIIRVWIIYFF